MAPGPHVEKDSGGGRALVHRLFVLGVIAKGVDGVLETIGGILLWVARPGQIEGLVRLLTQHELSEDPHDLIANMLLRGAHHFSGDVKLFGAIYLLSHGAVKIGLVAALLRGRHWAYPAAIAVFVAFLAYQLYRYTHTHSVWLLVLSVLDVFVIALTWLEYRRLRRAA